MYVRFSFVNIPILSLCYRGLCLNVSETLYYTFCRYHFGERDTQSNLCVKIHRFISVCHNNSFQTAHTRKITP